MYDPNSVREDIRRRHRELRGFLILTSLAWLYLLAAIAYSLGYSAGAAS